MFRFAAIALLCFSSVLAFSTVQPDGSIFPDKTHLFVKTRPKVDPTGNPADVTCPNNGGTCPSGSTCCPAQGGGYGCCPLVNAVCCSDDVHCCPNGYTCDVQKGECLKGNPDSIPIAKKTPVNEYKGVDAVQCPNNGGTCPTGSTCCQVQGGGYGCCPYVSAVCCSDDQHCCPNGYTCDVAKGQCNKGSKAANNAVYIFTRKRDIKRINNNN